MRVGGEERREEGEVFGGGDDGDGKEIGGGEVVGEVENGDHVALGWVWDY